MPRQSRKQSSDPTPEEFTLRAIEQLKKPEQKGIHTVYSGFNEAFRIWFPDKDPITEVQALAKAGKIDFRLAKGGAVIYPPGKKPAETASGETALKRMGLAK